jgi:type II secretory pathway component PulM
MANERLDRVRAYLAGRSTRERMFLLGGGLALLVLLGYGLLYEPQNEARGKLAKRLPAERAELRLMRVQAAEIERLRTRMGDSLKAGLEQRVKSSAATFGIAGRFAQFVAVSNDQIQLSTQPLATQTWIDWLADLERQGVVVARCRIDASEQAGLARLELTLTGSQR